MRAVSVEEEFSQQQQLAVCLASSLFGHHNMSPPPHICLNDESVPSDLFFNIIRLVDCGDSSDAW